MNTFQLVKQILDETYDQIPGSDKDKRAAVSAELEALRLGYGRVKLGVGFDYESPAVRFAYVFAYVTCHTCLVYEEIVTSRPLAALVSGEKASISSIGGGPGSDFLGVIRYAVNLGLRPRLRFNIFERERAWSNTWAFVEDKVSTNLNVSTQYNHFDVTDKKTWRAYDKFLDSDLFTMIYFVSEIWSRKDEAEPFFDYFLGGASRGALLLYIDFRDSELASWLDALAERHGWELLTQESRYTVPPPDEQMADLGEYLQMFLGADGKPAAPRLRSRIDVRIARKR